MHIEIERDAFSSIYLAIEEAVKGRDEEALKGGQKVRRVGPERELPDALVQGRLGHGDEVGDAEERQQDQRGPHSLSVNSKASESTGLA